MNKTVSVLLVLYNEAKHIERLAISIKSQSYKNISVYAIDNNSSDLSASLLLKYLPDAKIMCSKENLGYAKGNNILADEALKKKEDILFILNTDMELEEECVRILAEKLESNSEITGAGPVIYFGKDDARTDIIQCYAINANFNNGITNNLYKLKDNNLNLPDNAYVNSMHGGCFMIRSSAVFAEGLFNEDNFMYGDEIDLAYRINSTGGKFMVTKQAKVWHYHDWNTKNNTGNYLQYYYINRNRFLFFYRYNKYLSFIRVIISELLLFPVKIRWAKRTADIKLLKYYYMGYWHGLLNKKGKAEIEFR